MQFYPASVDRNSYGTYRLYAVKDASLDHGETDYGVDSMGIELPWCRKEWIDLTLVQVDTGSEFSKRVTIDALHQDSGPVEELLDRNNMKLA